MKKDNIDRYFNTDSLNHRQEVQSYLSGVKGHLLQIYSNIKMYLSPSYQAAEALVLNKKITPSNLEQLIAISEGREEGTTYDRDVLEYANKILKKDRKNK